MTMQMKIAVLMSHDTRNYKLGGEIFAENLSYELREIGNEVHIFRGFSSRNESFDSKGVYVHNHSQVNFPFIGSYFALRKMMKSIKEEEVPGKFDWIIMIGGGTAIVSSKLKSRNLAFFIIDTAMNEYRAVQKQLPSISFAAVKMNLFFKAISIGEKRGVKYSKFVICITHSQIEEIRNLYNIDHKKILFVPLGLPDLWYGEQVNQGSDIPTLINFIYFGAGKRRNIDLFLDCLRDLKEDGFSVSGTVVRANEEEILKLRSMPDLDMQFYNNIGHESLVRLYSSSLALVIPSYREGFCIPVIEAASQSVPTIASDLPQLHDLIINNETGILIDNYLPENWVNAMRKLIIDKSFLGKLKIGAREMADKFRLRKIAAELNRSLKEELE
jgi:glycosyltransferase involved in cell wall biosynthesis